MVFDHVAFILPGHSYYALPYAIFHGIGRLSAPLFFYLLAVGYRHSSNLNRYSLRLFIFALLSVYPYILFKYNGDFTDNYLRLNILFTMFFGLQFLRVIHYQQKSIIKISLLVLISIIMLFCDEGFFALAVIIISDTLMDDRKKFANVFLAVTLVYFFSNLGVDIGDSGNFIKLSSLLSSLTNITSIFVWLCYFLPIPIILRDENFYQKPQTYKKPNVFVKYAFYAFYPFHLIVLSLLRIM
jgi:hypothetical protein